MTVRLAVREMRLAEVNLRIDYFHDAPDEHLRRMGVDRARLPARHAWRAFHEEDFARPLKDRLNYLLVWECDGEAVGFSSADHITFGAEAFMHLHIVRPQMRQQGMGAAFVEESARLYFESLELVRLFSEPNALNTAPNRALQRAGFRFLFTHETTPGTINYPQLVTRWVLDRPTSA